MFQKIIRVLGGDPNKREIERGTTLVDQINSLESEFESLTEAELRARTDEFRRRLSQDETLDDLLPEAFAAVREASKRTLGLRHFDVQMIGGITLHSGKIAEMRTGEGKTLVATLPIYLNALTGKGVHLVTVNDYLARRDARWMAPIYQALGLTVGVLQMAARTENGRMAFLVDLEKTSPHEDQHQLNMVPRREAYQTDITYGTNSEFGFDYLRDNLTMRLDDRVQRGHNFAIIDEVDNILIDEARTPLIISGPASEDTEWYARMAQVVRQLNPEDYEVSEKDHTVSLTEIGEGHVEQLLEQPLRDPDRPEDISPEQARLLGYLEQALRSQFLYRRNKDYLVQGGKVVIVDEFTGRLMPGRRWSDGLHQAVEAKEGVKVEPENVTYATITLQNYFRMYSKLAGMTGTALTEAEEFYKIYKLDVLPIPTNLEFVATRSESPLTEVEDRDQAGYRYAYYARRGDSAKTPVFWRRQDFPDVVYRTQEAKLRAITQEILHFHIRGRPQLVGTTSVEHSERLSARLRPEPIRRLLQTMLLRQAWLEKNKRQDDERAIPELAPLYRPLDDLQAADLRQMARSLDLPLNPEDPENLGRLVRLVDLKPGDEGRLVSVLQGGVAHQVLNARKHDEESQIIARAGAFGSVTIATNMAGRGVDIKLGGDLPEEVLGDANRALVKAGHDNAYDMTHSERRRALLSVDLSEVGLYEEGARAFLEYLDNMERVRELGGLHVIGSERHEARRIDNQLRGRAARQGDPGSSRFYLALDDDLMRLFGGQQVEGLLARLNIDEAVPIESGLVGRLVEQSQTRVEGANFDVRKHLLEYDDVLNSQRARIYSQRDQVFTKEDLREDVSEMLQAELQKRIPEALKDEEGPWKLLAYLEEIQPALEYEDVIFPSYTQRLMLFELTRYIDEASTGAAGADKRTKDGRAPEGRTPDKRTPDGQGVILQALLALAEQALDMEHEHLMKAAQELLDRSEETLQAQIDERLDALAALVEGWKDISPEEAEGPRRPQDLAEEMAAAVRMPVRLTPEQNRQLLNDPEPVAEAVGKQVSMQLMALMANRLVGSFERRLEESLNLRTIQIQEADWNEVRETLRQALEETLTRRRERLLGSRSQDSRTQEAQGQIARDLSQLLPREAADGQAGLSDELFIRLLGAMARGTRVAFDRKTHRQNFQYTTRLRYSFLAARLLQDQPPQSVTADVLEHLEQAEVMIGRMWGRSEWNRLLQAEATLGQLTGKVKDEIQVALDAQHGAGHFESVAAASLQSYSTDDRDGVVEILGRRVLSELYRQLLLGVVSELWVDYLTRVEALRVSIGLEAYAQRDPLVQYKSQATEMFSNLIASVRSGVISRMFTYRPRQVAAASAVAAPPVERSVEEASEAGAGTPARSAAPASTAAAPGGQEGGSGGRHKKKRKRH